MKNQKKKKKKSKEKQRKEYIAKLKTLYKKDKLKFDSKKITEAILKDPYFKKGITS